MKLTTDTMATVFAHHRAMIRLGVFLDGMADIAQVDTRLDQVNANAQAFMADAGQAFGSDLWFADEKHFTGVTVKAVLDDGDIDIDAITLFQQFVTGDAVADYMVDRGADRFGKATVIEGCRDGLLLVDNILVTDTVKFLGGHTRYHVGML